MAGASSAHLTIAEAPKFFFGIEALQLLFIQDVKKVALIEAR
jgi:hypothetical protein